MADSTKTPLDYKFDYDALQQRQALTQALMAKALNPVQGQMVGGNFASPGALAQIGAPIMQALMAKHSMKKDQDSAKELSERYKHLQGGLDEKYGHTPVKMKGPDGELRDVLVGDRGTIKPIEGFGPAVKQEATAGGQLYDPYAGKKGEWMGEKFGPTQAVNGEAVQFDERSGKAHQVANRPTQVSVRPTMINQGESEFMKTVGKDTGEMVKNARLAKQQGQATLGTAAKLESLEKQGLFSGPTANIATSVGAFAQAMGIPVDAAKLGANEAYRSAIGEQAARALAGPGGAKMTDKDMDLFLSQFPQLIQSPQGRAQIVGRLRHAAQADIGYANEMEQRLNESFPEAGRLLGITPSAQSMPPAGMPSVPPTPQGSAPVSLDDYLKSRGGR